MWSIWLVFCDNGFHSVCPLRDKDKRLWKIPPGRDWLWRKLGLVLMGWAMFSKSLIQFSIDGRGCVHSLLFDLRPNYGGVMKIMATSFERSHACTPVLSAPDPTADHRWPMPPPETPGHSQASLGQFLLRSLILSPGSWYTQGFVCALQESCVSSGEFPQSCVSYGGSVLATPSKRAYATPRPAEPRAPAPAAGHCWPVPPQEKLKYSKAGLAQSLWGLLVCTIFCLSPRSISG